MEHEGIELEYCPTEEMLGDFFTKPLQGGLFRTMRNIVMGTEGPESYKRRKLGMKKRESLHRKEHVEKRNVGMDNAGNENKIPTTNNELIGDDRDDDEATVKSSNESRTVVQNTCFYEIRK